MKAQGEMLKQKSSNMEKVLGDAIERGDKKTR